MTSPSVDDIRRLRRERRCREAAEQTAEWLEAEGAVAKSKDQLENQRFINRELFGTNGLVWEYVCQACNANGYWAECQNALERLIEASCVEAVGSIYRYKATTWTSDYAVNIFRGQLCGALAALDDFQGLRGSQDYLKQAADAYQRAFSACGDNGLGKRIAAQFVARVKGKLPFELDRDARHRGETWVLMADRFHAAAAVRLIVQLVPGDDTGVLVPDPVPMGLLPIGAVMLASFPELWKFVRARCPSGMGARWWFESAGLKTRYVEGQSGEAAALAAMQAAVESVRLDPYSAISAQIAKADGHFQRDGNGHLLLDEVGAGKDKREAAKKAGCHHVLFCENTATEVRDTLACRSELPEVADVQTFEEAWDHLAFRGRALEAYFLAESERLLRSLRFRPERLNSLSADQVLEALHSLHVPWRVVTKVQVPRSDAEALHLERQREVPAELSSPKPQDRAREDDDLPADAVERLRTEEREHILPLEEAFQDWMTGGAGALVILGHPGYGKTLLLGLIWVELWRKFLHASSEAVVVNFSESERLSLQEAWGPTLLPLRVTCRELGEQLHCVSRPSLRDGVRRILVERLKDQCVQLDVVDAFDKLLKEWFDTQMVSHAGTHQRAPVATRADSRDEAATRDSRLFSGRVLLLVDGWDERIDGHEERLLQSLQDWAVRHPLVLTSRGVGYTPSLLAGAPEWWLIELDTPDGVEQLVRRWFSDSEQSTTLLGELNRRPQILETMRVPLLGALVCSMWDRGVVPPLPGKRAMLLLEGLKALLLDGCRGPAILEVGKSLRWSASKVAEPMLRALARLAYTTFRGERWVLREGELVGALRDEELQPLGDALELKEALTGRFGVFTVLADGTLEFLHQSFAEVLYAYRVVQICGDSSETFDREKFKQWLHEESGPRRFDRRFHEVWCHLAVLLPHTAALLEELWAIYNSRPANSAGSGLNDKEEVVSPPLCLAGHCLAAAMSVDPYIATLESARHIVTALLDSWYQLQRLPRSSGARVEECCLGLVELGQAGNLMVLEGLMRTMFCQSWRRIAWPYSSNDASQGRMEAIYDRRDKAIGRYGYDLNVASEAARILDRISPGPETMLKSLSGVLGSFPDGALDAFPNLLLQDWNNLETMRPESPSRETCALRDFGMGSTDNARSYWWWIYELRENEFLLREAADQFEDAEVRSAVWIRSEKINRLLRRRRELWVLARGSVPQKEAVFRLGRAPIPTVCEIVGRAAIPHTRTGPDSGVQIRLCERCGGLLNWREIYPELELKVYELDTVDCVCP